MSNLTLRDLLMATALSNHIVATPALYTYDPEYRAHVESMLPLLRNSSSTSVIGIGVEMAHLYKGDLEGFLLANGVNIEDHYLIMRVNDIDDSFSFSYDERKTILIPSLSLVNNLKDVYRGKMKK